MNQEVMEMKCGSMMFLVPHPDDEILMGAGILYEAVRQGSLVTVVMVTNGDYESSDFSVGRSRLRETLASLEVLGVDKNQVEFLGYADTGMPKEDSFLYQL
ncbi:MAG: PIG-L family deacetylase, partial [Hungatella sp.]